MSSRLETSGKWKENAQDRRFPGYRPSMWRICGFGEETPERTFFYNVCKEIIPRYLSWLKICSEATGMEQRPNFEAWKQGIYSKPSISLLKVLNVAWSAKLIIKNHIKLPVNTPWGVGSLLRFPLQSFSGRGFRVWQNNWERRVKKLSVFFSGLFHNWHKRKKVEKQKGEKKNRP